MKKVAFRNLGCKVNEYEMEYMQQIMAEKGFFVVPFDEKADIYVINTCTVTNIADRKSRQMLHRAKKLNPEAIVVAVGCYVQTDTEGASNDEAVDIMVGNNHKAELADIVLQYIEDHKISMETVADLTHEVSYEDMHIKTTAEHTRAFVKIQDGCNQFCSYCAIPLARGRVRSRSYESVVDEARDLAANGYQELVITGIHLSSYGLDFKDSQTAYNQVAIEEDYTNEELLNVLKMVAEVEGIKRIRLGSLEPRLITRPFLEEISKINKLCPHFHLSLQSGCDETLKRMNRRYTAQEYLNSCNLLREYFENPAITTDVIVGFPDESDEEFEKSLTFVEKAEFFELHVFKYSKRKNTPAAVMKGQIADAVKDERSNQMIELGERMSLAYREQFKDKEVEVLFEESKNGMICGHTREYLYVGMKGNSHLKGQIVTLKLDGESLFFI